MGLFKSRSSLEAYLIKNPTRKGRKLSQETKDKLSIARKKYLSENPDKCVWKTNDKFKSIPCEKVKLELTKLGIKFEEELQPLLHIQRMFSMDISFPELKIAFEINGGQHYSGGVLAEYYQKRHDLIESAGWKLYEIPYHVAMREDFVYNFIQPIILGKEPLNYDTSLYQKMVAAP
jgi:hypothetical protein